MQARTSRRYLPALAGLLLLGMIVAVQFRYSAVFDGIRHAVFDTYNQLQPRTVQHVPLVVVHIDETTVARYGAWPWDGRQIARLIQSLAGYEASVVGLDMALHSADRQGDDGAFAVALQMVPVVAGTVLNRGEPGPVRAYRKGGFAVMGDLENALGQRFSGLVAIREDLLAGAAGIGALNINPDRDGKLRRYPMLFDVQGRFFPSFGAEVLRVASGSSSYALKRLRLSGLPGGSGVLEMKIGPRVLPLGEHGEVWMHYADRGDWLVLSAADVIERRVPAEQLAGNIALVGVSLAGVGGEIVSPFGERLSTVEVQAQGVSQVASGVNLVRPEWSLGAEVIAGVVAALLLMLVSTLWRGLVPVMLGLLLIAGFFYTGWYLFDTYRLLIDPLSPGLTALAVFLLVTLGNHVLSESDRRWVEAAFSRYVSPNLVRYLVAHPDKLRLSGERRHCSFVFTDLEDFTPLVERCDPQKLVSLMNAYLEGMVSIVFRHEGTVDRIVGDAVAVMFSAPVEQPDHAARAVACALEMDRFAVDFSQRMMAKDLPLGTTRIGVHCGEVVVGNFGGGGYFDYRAFGDPINTAARLEVANKPLGTRICLSESVVLRSGDKSFRPIGPLLLKGKQHAIRAYTLPLAASSDSGAHQAYLDALAQLEAGQPESAARYFEQLLALHPGDALCRFHRERIIHGEGGATIDLR